MFEFITTRDFLTNFLANVLSDMLLAIVLYVAITRPRERKIEQERINQTLGLLKSEFEINASRTKAYIQALSRPGGNISTLFPLRYTRGAWNALKESGFLQQLNDVRLVYLLLRVNEASLVANKNLRRFQLAFLEDTGGDMELLAEAARQDSERLLRILNATLLLLEEYHLPSFSAEDLAEWMGGEERDGLE